LAVDTCIGDAANSIWIVNVFHDKRMKNVFTSVENEKNKK